MSIELMTRLQQLESRVAELKSLDSIRGIRARVYRTTDQTLTTGVAAAITFDAERYDTDAFHSTSVNTSRLTIPFAGYYRVTAGLRYASNATGFRQAQIRLNGTTLIGSVVVSATATNITDLQVTADYLFAASDYVELIAGQTSGGNLNVSAAGNFTPEFWIDKLV